MSRAIGIVAAQVAPVPYDPDATWHEFERHVRLLAGMFPKVARTSVVYRGDDVGVIDDAMAEEIVAAVGNRSSIVWVDEDGFRVGPAR